MSAALCFLPGSLRVVAGLGLGIPQRRKSCEEHGFLSRSLPRRLLDSPFSDVPDSRVTGASPARLEAWSRGGAGSVADLSEGRAPVRGPILEADQPPHRWAKSDEGGGLKWCAQEAQRAAPMVS